MTENEKDALIIRLREQELRQDVRGKQIALTYDLDVAQGRTVLDAVVKLDSRIIGVFEFKRTGALRDNGADQLSLIDNLVALVPLLRFYIISDGKDFLVFDQFGEERSRKVDFEGVCAALLRQPDPSTLEKSCGIVANGLNEALEKAPVSEEVDGVVRQTKIRYMAKDIEFEPAVISFRLRGERWDTQSAENRLFYTLIPEKRNDRLIHRYGSLTMVFSTLSNNTFRMNGVAGMNDRSEVDYVERYLKITGGVGPGSHYKTVEKFNQRFISSCSMKADDLTQWRLYANDSKGACLVFRVKPSEMSGMQLRPVSYANEKDKHPELDVIAAWIRKCNKQNLRVMLQTLDNWSSFFKPKEYSIEMEIRLLFLDNPDQEIKPYEKRGWGLTNTHNILNPYVEFELNKPNFPLELDSISLGPNCPEQSLNKLQFQQLIREQRRKPNTQMDKVKVAVSKIKNYR